MGNKVTFEDYLQDIEAIIQSLIRNLTIKGMDNEDLVQELFICAWKAWAFHFDPSKNVKYTTFLIAVLKNRIRELCRNTARRNIDTISVDVIVYQNDENKHIYIGDFLRSHSDAPEDLLHCVEAKTIIKKIIMASPPNRRGIIIDKLQGYKDKEICQRNNCSQPLISYYYKSFQKKFEKEYMKI